MLRANHRLISRENQGAFHHVLKFANIACPSVVFQNLQRLRRQLWRGHRRGEFIKEVGRELRNISNAVAQWRNINGEAAETVV